jgi:hypothetical protein
VPSPACNVQLPGLRSIKGPWRAAHRIAPMTSAGLDCAAVRLSDDILITAISGGISFSKYILSIFGSERTPVTEGPTFLWQTPVLPHFPLRDPVY